MKKSKEGLNSSSNVLSKETSERIYPPLTKELGDMLGSAQSLKPYEQNTSAWLDLVMRGEHSLLDEKLVSKLNEFHNKSFPSFMYFLRDKRDFVYARVKEFLGSELNLKVIPPPTDSWPIMIEGKGGRITEEDFHELAVSLVIGKPPILRDKLEKDLSIVSGISLEKTPKLFQDLQDKIRKDSKLAKVFDMKDKIREEAMSLFTELNTSHTKNIFSEQRRLDDLSNAAVASSKASSRMINLTIGVLIIGFLEVLILWGQLGIIGQQTEIQKTQTEIQNSQTGLLNFSLNPNVYFDFNDGPNRIHLPCNDSYNKTLTISPILTTNYGFSAVECRIELNSELVEPIYAFFDMAMPVSIYVVEPNSAKNATLTFDLKNMSSGPCWTTPCWTTLNFKIICTGGPQHEYRRCFNGDWNYRIDPKTCSYVYSGIGFTGEAFSYEEGC